MSDAEGTFGYGLPEVGILLPMFVGSRSIADDAETDEGHVVEVAYLGNGTRLHIHGQSFGEMTFDVIQFGVVGDELVATPHIVIDDAVAGHYVHPLPPVSHKYTETHVFARLRNLRSRKFYGCRIFYFGVLGFLPVIGRYILIINIRYRQKIRSLGTKDAVPLSLKIIEALLPIKNLTHKIMENNEKCENVRI